EGLEPEAAKDIFGSFTEELAQENLIRSPELLGRVREELAKYESISVKAKELEQLLHQHQDEEKWLDQFIEALYTETIIRKGALYVYDREPEEEAWAPFANLMKSSSYVEHEVFESFRQLDEKNRSTLMRKAARRVTELTATEDTSKLLAKL
ncbi:hypothetical protein K0U00_47985, partial [Paenibacillus sepulcri]|nr:hypothetical protein [Paenibacillus sepulcri]